MYNLSTWKAEVGVSRVILGCIVFKVSLDYKRRCFKNLKPNFFA